MTKVWVIFWFLSSASCRLNEYVQWQQISYKNLPASSYYDPYVNVPFGVSNYKDKLFVTIPRRHPGIPSTLNTVELIGSPPFINPLLMSYPSYQFNLINTKTPKNPFTIVSVYRSRVDRCDRLWFVDTGVLEYPKNITFVQKPSIWTIDLKTDKLLGRYEIPSSIVQNGIGLASITLDDDICSNTYAYIPDWINNVLIVFSLQEERSWRFEHNFFYFNPFEGDFSVDGEQFQWQDGIFSLTLSETKLGGFKTAFFHPLASHGEFTVSTEVLRNEFLASRKTHGKDFRFLGQRGTNSQSGSHAFDVNTNVIFFTQMQKNAVSCWNVHDHFKPANIHLVEQNNATLIYPADLTIDLEGTLFVLSNRLPRFLYSKYNTKEFNFNIYQENVFTAGLSCLVDS